MYIDAYRRVLEYLEHKTWSLPMRVCHGMYFRESKSSSIHPLTGFLADSQSTMQDLSVDIKISSTFHRSPSFLSQRSRIPGTVHSLTMTTFPNASPHHLRIWPFPYIILIS